MSSENEANDSRAALHGGQTIPFDEVMSRIGLGYFHVRLLVTCGLGFCAAAVEVVLTSFLFVELRRVWHESEYSLSILPTVVGIGSLLGEITWGRLADLYGRRLVFLVTALLVVIFGVASAASPNIGVMAAIRFMVGFGYGGNIAVDFTLFSELLPTDSRGRMLFLMSAFWPLGQLLTCAIAWIVIPHTGWPVFLVVCALPSLITCVLRLLIPESPRWLLLQGREEEAKQVCHDMAVLNGLTPEQVGLSKGTRLVLSNETEPLSGRGDKSSHFLVRLFNRSLWRTTVGCLVFSGMLSWGGNVTTLFMPTFLEMKGINAMNRYLTMALSAAAQFPGILAAASLGLVVGRRRPMQLSLMLVALALICFAWAQQRVLVLVCSCFANACLEFGWALCHVYVPEAFPTELRASAQGIISGSGTIISLAGPWLTAWLLDLGTAGSAVAIFAVIMFLGSLGLLVLLEQETMDRHLQDWASAS